MAAKSKVAAASAKSATKKDSTSKQQFLSEEKVVDSDEDDNDSSSDDNDISTDDAVLSTTGAASLAASVLNSSKGKLTVRRSSDSDATSSDEDVSMEDAAEEQGDDAGSVSEESEDDSSIPPPSAQRAGTTLKKPNIKAVKVNGVKRKTTSQDETASKSGDESDDNDEQAGNHAPKKVRFNGEEVQNTNTLPTRSPKPAQHSSLAPVPAQAYIPPPGYRAVDTTGGSSISIPSLKGKTLWHISAPASMPVSSITSMTLAAMKSGNTVVQHKDIDYTLTEVAASEQAVFIPGKDGYKAAKQTVKKSFTLRPAFTLPTILARAAARDAGSLAAGNIATAAVTTIRPQPEGLKMRYKPPAFGKGDPGIIGGTSDDPANTSKSTFQFPRAVGPSTDGDGSRIADGDVRKKKKDKKSLKQAPNGLADDVEPQAEMPAKRPKALDKVAAKIVDNETDGEAARLKAERKARKAAKKKARAEAA